MLIAKQIIAIDFDGTCVTHCFPRIGVDIGAEHVLRKLVDCGHRLILWTMRSDVANPQTEDPTIIAEPGNYLSEAVKWFAGKEIPLWGVQANQEQSKWTHSPKAYAHMYIDDAALGCPLKFDYSISPRPFVDWVEVERILIEKGLI